MKKRRTIPARPTASPAVLWYDRPCGDESWEFMGGYGGTQEVNRREAQEEAKSQRNEKREGGRSFCNILLYNRGTERRIEERYQNNS